jgi:hypothetical protein
MDIPPRAIIANGAAGVHKFIANSPHTDYNGEKGDVHMNENRLARVIRNMEKAGLFCILVAAPRHPI